MENYCKRCGLSIPKNRESNFCSDICNLMPSNFNNQEATIYRDGYNKAKQEERERILKELPKEKDEREGDVSDVNELIKWGSRIGFNECLKQIKDIIKNA